MMVSEFFGVRFVRPLCVNQGVTEFRPPIKGRSKFKTGGSPGAILALLLLNLKLKIKN
jgi:hypothetical protein